MKKIIFIITFVLISSFSFGVQAASIGDSRSFNVDQSYDIIGREKVTAFIQEISARAYFYLDENWWSTLDSNEQSRVKQALTYLGEEFDEKIYPTLVGTFGSEWNPGIDKDSRITILIHPMKEGSGGYFVSGDEYLRIQNPKSNEREMVYMNSDYISSSLFKSFLAHEFVHLITFNQKERIQGKVEDIWLNEARADYAPTLMGYDVDYDISNLKSRVKTFLNNSSDSITEWQGENKDYGVLNIFTQYLVDHYGIGILSQSMKVNRTGIDSLNYILKDNNVDKDFSGIFSDWLIAVLLNDCNLGKYYCYKNEQLKDLRISPSINFLPLNGKSTLGVSQSTKDWAGNWFKLIGGNGSLKIEFIGNPENSFKVFYIVNRNSNYSINSFSLNSYQRGEIVVSGLGDDVSSIIIIPTIQNKVSNFSSNEPAISYFWSASVIDKTEEIIPKYLEKPVTQMSRDEILGKISEIESLLNQLRNQLGGVINPVSETVSCSIFDQNLSFGLMNNNRVKCLQEFLKNQGTDIYPEGLVTGNFLSMTKQAVVRFQEKFASAILNPLGLINGTGYVGLGTRNKINELLTK
jgi:hypothetical protein